ncbi:SMI1/KNR4 family protein [Aliterella atlantica]|nr:SMI1/KNR4 family protein [Aliterella atlantica]
MSSIMQVIDRIAVYYARLQPTTTLDTKVYEWLLCNGYKDIQISQVRDYRQKISPDLQAILSNSYPPRLNLEQIKAITQDYPFELPVELCDLYQRGNGCLPIGLDDAAKDWTSFDNYVNFPFDGNYSFLPLQEAMRLYQAFTKSSDDIDPRWFPISYFDDRILSVIGSEQQQETSPVIGFYDSDFTPKTKWSSLTNMLLTWIETQQKA